MKFLKPLALSLCMALTLCACTGPGGSSGGTEGDPAVPKGRYLEHQTDFPPFTSVVAMNQTAPDTYYVLGTKNGYEPPYEVAYSGDGGRSWQTKEYPLAEKFLVGAAFTAAGGLYVNYLADPSDAESSACKTALVTETSFTDIEGVARLEQFSQGLAVTGSGDLLVSGGDELHQINLQEKSESAVYRPNAMVWPGCFSVREDTLAISGKDAITVYDCATGEQSGEISYVTSSEAPRVIALQQDGSGIFYCDPSGLYRVAMEGVMAERLIDGSLTSFSMPSVNLAGLFQNADGSFLLLCQGVGTTELKHFIFDETVPVEPGEELVLVSLREDPYIRQVIGLYQREHPDVKVTSRILLAPAAGTASDAMTPSDALRQLSAELLAGAGPDVLLLDGMSVESLMAQGVLGDMSESLREVQGELHPKVIPAGYQPEGRLYAVPTRFSVPIMVGMEVEGIHSLNDFADYLSRQENPRIGFPAETIMEAFYPACSARWFGGESMPDVPAMTEDLTALQRILALSGDEFNMPHPRNQAMVWSGSGTALIYGELGELGDMANLYSAMEKRGGGTLRLFPDAEGGTLVLSGILGVNAAGKSVERAQDFVRFALNAQTQNVSLEMGMPVNLKALEAIANSREPGFYCGGGAMTNRETGESYELAALWPTDPQMELALTLLKAAGNPVAPNELIRQVVLDETAKLFSETQTVETTVEAITRTAERQLQERAG